MKTKAKERLIVLLILLVGTVLLLVSTKAPRPLAEGITEHFTPTVENPNSNSNEKEQKEK
jgi:hypothetical protein